MEMPKYLTEREVSQITNLALPTLRNYRQQGRGPAYFKAGRAVRYRVEDVIGYMEKNRVEPTNR
jgi:predicted DNA-binding transcriptional regulator AlpA